MKTAFIAGISMLLASGAALAEDQLFKLYDTNGDGVIGTEEAKASQTLSAYFVLFDIDGNGSIDTMELAKIVGETPSSSPTEQLTKL
jgi:Ca2+-binding EF-hand superfamily protein